MRNNDERIDNIIQLIRDYDYLLDTAFERNAATITLQKIRGILGMEGYQPGAELNKRRNGEYNTVEQSVPFPNSHNAA